MCVRRSCLVLNVGRADWNFIRDLDDAVASILGSVFGIRQFGCCAGHSSLSSGLFMSRQVAPNHQPRVSLKDAVQELAANLAQVGGLSPEFRTSSRIRLRRLQELMAAGFLDEELRWRRR